MRHALSLVLAAGFLVGSAGSAAALVDLAEKDRGQIQRLLTVYLADRANRVTQSSTLAVPNDPARLTSVTVSRLLGGRLAAEAAELDARRSRYLELGGAFKRAEVRVRDVLVNHLGVAAAAVTLLEQTRLHYRNPSSDQAPQHLDYTLSHRFSVVREHGAWVLDADSVNLPGGPLSPFTYVAQGRATPLSERLNTRAITDQSMKLWDRSTSAEPPTGQAKLGYDYTAMVNYARQWAYARNPQYPRFDNDCANFVSQALRAGGWEIALDPSSGYPARDPKNWYHYQSSAIHYWSRTWSISHELYFFARDESRRATPLRYFEELSIGDILQADWNNAEGQPAPDGRLDHTMMVSRKEGTSPNQILLTYHTEDRFDHPLSLVLAAAPLSRANYYGLRT
ncbi:MULTISPECIES: amidase domain-containing protein [unclassified Crossiella]|uniref:amidase domain-containing protein n=1 Tax=unclassified Crossiella TaxID=2620835 RepID=UPI001FFF6DB3|nr:MULTISPECIES: amidase domain-containing protein [unclassified Crossiella]MCK2238454.1 amidase domain-containing protein [Crossiella sp. S99.2]MCK2251976.1 amidase domain-containing protein [Crossiella sp. S99.1]